MVWTRYIQRLEDLNEASEAVDVTCSDGLQPKTIVLCPWFEEDNRWFSAYLTQKSSFAAAFYVYISMHAISIRITYQYLSHILHSDERYLVHIKRKCDLGYKTISTKGLAMLKNKDPNLLKVFTNIRRNENLPLLLQKLAKKGVETNGIWIASL